MMLADREKVCVFPYIGMWICRIQTQARNMKSIQIIIFLMFTVSCESYCQVVHTGYEKHITTVEFYGNTSDTSLQIIKFDSIGNIIPEPSENITISTPMKMDTTNISENERRIESTWRDGTTSVRMEINRGNEQIIIVQRASDTLFYSRFNYDNEGFPVSGMVVNNLDTSRYRIAAKISMDELKEIHSNVTRESEFVNFVGEIEFLNRNEIRITDLEEPKNTIKIELLQNLKPKMIIVSKWHDYHKIVFKNRYSYKYENNKLVEIKRTDMFGDLEMKKIIEYK